MDSVRVVVLRQRLQEEIDRMRRAPVPTNVDEAWYARGRQVGLELALAWLEHPLNTPDPGTADIPPGSP